jgi:hypothetical protein
MDMLIALTEFDPPWRMGSTTTTPGGAIRGGLTFERVGGGTRMRWAWEVRPTGVARVLGPLGGVVGRRQERACWEGLKQYLEEARTEAPS